MAKLAIGAPLEKERTCLLNVRIVSHNTQKKQFVPLFVLKPLAKKSKKNQQHLVGGQNLHRTASEALTQVCTEQDSRRSQPKKQHNLRTKGPTGPLKPHVSRRFLSFCSKGTLFQFSVQELWGLLHWTQDRTRGLPQTTFQGPLKAHNQRGRNCLWTRGLQLQTLAGTKYFKISGLQ